MKIKNDRAVKISVQKSLTLPVIDGFHQATRPRDMAAVRASPRLRSLPRLLSQLNAAAAAAAVRRSFSPASAPPPPPQLPEP